MDVPKLISWLSARQYAPEGGFSGRTNKLVDGCYSHWVGGCWPLIEASMASPDQDQDPDPDPKEQHRPCVGSVDHGNAATRSSLFSREALIRYIMTCCQDLSKRGGLRDKPSKYDHPVHLPSFVPCFWHWPYHHHHVSNVLLGIPMHIIHATYFLA